MAGDWIKVEKATPRKPEIFGIAARLNISLDHAFAVCVRFWMWCDDHLIDGNAQNVTCLLLDDALGCPGIADALLSVGWLQVRSGSLVIPHFDRHLSASAKNRAETARSVAKSREKTQQTSSENVTDKALQKPLPEKRIEEKNTKTEEKKKRGAAPPFLPPTVDEVGRYCAERSNHVDAQKFVDFYSSKGWMIGPNKMKDWRAAVRTWENRNDRSSSSSQSSGQTKFERTLSVLERFSASDHEEELGGSNGASLCHEKDN